MLLVYCLLWHADKAMRGTRLAPTRTEGWPIFANICHSPSLSINFWNTCAWYSRPNSINMHFHKMWRHFCSADLSSRQKIKWIDQGLMGNLLKSWPDKRAGGPLAGSGIISHILPISYRGVHSRLSIPRPLLKNLRIIKLPNGPNGRQFVQPS